MVRLFTTSLVALTVSTAAAQSPIELVRRAALFYNSFQIVEIRGNVTEPIAGTSWQVSYEDTAWRAQPNFIPSDIRASAMDWVVSVGVNPHLTRADVSSTDDTLPTHWGFTAETFGAFGQISDRLTQARSAGTGIVSYKGQNHRCEIVDVTYDASPDFKPKTTVKHRRIYIDPKSLWILKLIDPDHSNGDVTFTVTSMRFNEPPPTELVSALRKFDAQPKTNAEWVGRSIPDVTLRDLSGSDVNLADLRGQPLLLDFWASWCGSCKRATALAQELSNTYGRDGLKVLTIATDNADDARSWLAFHHITLPALLDDDGAAWKAFDVPGIPVAIFFDDRGRTVQYWMGLDDENEVRSTIAAFFRSWRSVGNPSTAVRR